MVVFFVHYTERYRMEGVSRDTKRAWIACLVLIKKNPAIPTSSPG